MILTDAPWSFGASWRDRRSLSRAATELADFKAMWTAAGGNEIMVRSIYADFRVLQWHFKQQGPFERRMAVSMGDTRDMSFSL